MLGMRALMALQREMRTWADAFVGTAPSLPANIRFARLTEPALAEPFPRRAVLKTEKSTACR